VLLVPFAAAPAAVVVGAVLLDIFAHVEDVVLYLATLR
jgi:hypothetical protein